MRNFIRTFTLLGSVASALPHESRADPIEIGVAPAFDDNLPEPWTYAGCLKDDVEFRVLDRDYVTDAKGMTGEMCVGYCKARGWPFAGTEFGRECFCGTSINPDDMVFFDCTQPCAGNSTQACGAASRLSVYTNGGMGPQTNPGVSGFEYIGCYTDSVGARTLQFQRQPEGSFQISVSTCVNECKNNGFQYAGMEYGQECWCGNDIQNDANNVDGGPGVSGCSMVCSDADTEYCGGSNRINLYQNTETTTSGNANSIVSTAMTKKSSATSSVATASSTNIVQNGDFESDNLSPWEASANPLTPDQSQLVVTGYGYNEEHIAVVIDSAQGLASGTRSACLTQSIYHPLPGEYHLSAKIGRKAGEGATAKLSYNIFVDDKTVLTGSVCNARQGGCAVEALNGEIGFNSVTLDLSLSQGDVGYHKLSICAVYESISEMSKDIFALDDVVVVQP